MSMQDSTRLTGLVWILAMTGSQSKPSQSKDTVVLVAACLSHSKPKSSTREILDTALKEASMALSDELEALAKRHGALSYRNRADTQNPAFGFSAAGLASLLAEVRKQDDALILQLVEALEKADKISGYPNNRAAIKAGRARLEGKP